MDIRDQFQKVWKNIQEGESGEIIFLIEGKDYHRIFKPKERLILLGGGHIAKALCFFAARLEFDVTVVDDRPDFASQARFPEAHEVICAEFKEAIENLRIGPGDYVAVLTRGHQYDAECIRSVIRTGKPKYFGMLGSKKRTTALLESLRKEGLPEDRLQEICTPIGLAIGALTVDEIAISILSQMIQYRRNGGSGKHSQIMMEETFHEDVLKDLAETDEEKALLLVYETSGSTPVKSGCFMTINKEGRPMGTIGGGFVEAAAIEAACPLIGTGKSRTYALSLSNAQAGEEGMVCGGNMKIFLADL